MGLKYELEDLLGTPVDIVRLRESSDGFTLSESGMILLDSVCMNLVVIGESIKNLDRVRKMPCNYSGINWKQSVGMRDIIVHHYFNVDAEDLQYIKG